MGAYSIILEKENTLRVNFGDPAQNDQIVKDAAHCLDALVKSGKITGGEIIRVTGPASVPVAMVLAHGLSHLYQAVACYDPKLSKYVVAIAHGNKYGVGDLID